jgi:hypothetical protein
MSNRESSFWYSRRAALWYFIVGAALIFVLLVLTGVIDRHALDFYLI